MTGLDWINAKISALGDQDDDAINRYRERLWETLRHVERVLARSARQPVAEHTDTYAFYIAWKPGPDRQPINLPDGGTVWVRVEAMPTTNVAEAIDYATIRDDEALMNAHHGTQCDTPDTGWTLVGEDIIPKLAPLHRHNNN
jgi:hypothetical protein